MNRIGIFGGTFNPPHLGHIQAAKQAMSALNLSRLFLIPAWQAPHKQGVEDAAAQQRLTMLYLALKDAPQLEINTLELDRGGISYTVATLRVLKDW